MSDLDNILAYLLLNKDRYYKEYHLKRIGVFGSIARNEQNENSDIDLIVEFKKDTADLYLIKQLIKRDLEEKFNRSVDICREKYLKPYFKKQIQLEAKYV
ncbi:MAG: nucleotidyltransferase domain-containing protein [Bacteroidales bacterium]|nr:nucleotidyltransferase domain-containing protein [Bacteroidales bacterium]